MSTEGAKLTYFDSASKRIAYYGKRADEWMLRSPATIETDYVYAVNEKGNLVNNFPSSSHGVRPCLVLPQDVLVDDNQNVIGG